SSVTTSPSSILFEKMLVLDVKAVGSASIIVLPLNELDCLKKSEGRVKAPDRVASMLQQRRAWAEALHLSPDLAETLFHHLVAYFTSQELKQWRNET
ncbi:MAG: hypothetical protein J2P37_26450, partial [Ktedonobacteraceae bacterium]|nr:hypothetical protein [Ktedonobacteraceae bacterium]